MAFNAANYEGQDRLQHIEKYLGPLTGISVNAKDPQFAGGAKGDGVTDDTAAIQGAIDVCSAAGGGKVIIPPSANTYNITGLTLPAAGLVSLEGAGRGSSVLKMTSASGSALTCHGVSGVSPANNFSLVGFRLTATLKTALQVGLDLQFCSNYVADRVQVDTFGIGVQDDTTWYSDFRSVRVSDCDNGFVVPSTANSTATPKDYHACVARNNGTTGVLIGDKADRFKWSGGAIEANGIGAEVNGNNARNVTFEGVNFEDNTTNHVKVGTSGGPVVVGCRSCRFWSNGGPIGVAVNFLSIQQGFVEDCGFQNCTKGINVPAGSAVHLANNRPATVTTYATIGALTFTGNQRLLAGTDTVLRSDDNVATPTYGTTIASDRAGGNVQKVTVTNGTAFTLSNPTALSKGQTITYDIVNSSGGAHGVITWGATFLNGGAGTVGTGAFTGIANGKRRIIQFYYDGTNLIELLRTVDI